jgi:hypothetical protein
MFRYKHPKGKNVFDTFKLKKYSIWVSVIMYFDKQHRTRRYQFECECFNKEHARYLILKNFKKEITSETVKYIKTVKDRKFHSRYMVIDSIEEYPMVTEINLDDTDINNNIRLIRKDSLPLRRITFWS